MPGAHLIHVSNHRWPFGQYGLPQFDRPDAVNGRVQNGTVLPLPICTVPLPEPQCSVMTCSWSTLWSPFSSTLRWVSMTTLEKFASFSVAVTSMRSRTQRVSCSMPP